MVDVEGAVKILDVWTNLPKLVKVIGMRYKMAVVDKVDEDESDGECDQAKQRILHAREQTFLGGRDTSWHEVFHAVEYQMDLDLDHQVLTQLARGTLAVMRANPKYMKWLLAAEPKDPTVEGTK